MKAFRFLVFIPMCVLVFVIINFVFVALLNWTISKTGEWHNAIDPIYFILILPFFWGAVWGIFKLSAVGLAALLIPVSPKKKFALYTIGSISIVNTISLIVYYWTRDIYYSWKVVLMTMVVTVFILDFSTTVVLVFAKKESLYIDE